MTEEKICPKCGCVITGHPAISRKDNKTEICSNCGVIEALEDFKKTFEKGMSPAVEGLAKTVNSVAKEFIEIGDRVKTALKKESDH